MITCLPCVFESFWRSCLVFIVCCIGLVGVIIEVFILSDSTKSETKQKKRGAKLAKKNK